MNEVKEAAVKALAAGISVAGVVVIGQAVAWVRFSAADLPADQVMALLGRSELIAIGAVSLAYFAVGGILAVAAAYGLDSEADPKANPSTPNGLVVIVAVATVVGVLVGKLEIWATVTSIAGIVLGFALFLAFTHPPGKTTKSIKGRWFKDVTLDRWRRRLLGPLTAIVVLVLVWALWENRSWFPILCFGVAVLLGLLCFGIANKTKKEFQWYGVAVFLSAVVFGAVVGIAKTEDAPKVQPLGAIVETSGGAKPIKGIFVGETNDRLYYGSIRDEGGTVENTGTLLWVSCDQVVTYGVGRLQLVPTAIGHGAETVLADLDRQPRELVPPPTDPDAEPQEKPSGCKSD
jgi:hypothetical protein